MAKLTIADLTTDGEVIGVDAVNFLQLPPSIDKALFDKNVRWLMDETGCSELSARLQKGERAHHVLQDGRALWLMYDVKMDWSEEKGVHVPWKGFLVLMSLGNDFTRSELRFDTAEEAADMWANFERKWAVEIALKALEIKL